MGFIKILFWAPKPVLLLLRPKKVQGVFCSESLGEAAAGVGVGCRENAGR